MNMFTTSKQTIINALNECVAACNYCSSACLSEENVAMLAACIRTDIDCAAICDLTSNLLARQSNHGMHLLKECVEVCNLCAAECEKHAHHHDHCKKCAEACRICAEVCESAM
jgi:hypothetical protein